MTKIDKTTVDDAVIIIIINGKNSYDQTIDSDIKRFEENRKLTTGQGEDYTTGCLIDYDYKKIIIDQ